MNPSLNLAIARLVNIGTDNFAIWVVHAPYPSGYVLRDCVWSQQLTQAWREWQQMFAPHNLIDIPPGQNLLSADQPPTDLPQTSSQRSYGARLMQDLGIKLWRWIFDGPILGSLEHSQGMAMGQNTRLRLQLEIRDPDLIVLPWEIMHRKAGQPVISLGQQMLFSRTTSEVDPLPYLRADRVLNILLVLGEDSTLQLEQEAAILKQTLADGTTVGSNAYGYAPCMVNTLVQPTPGELIKELETKAYNVFFYAGHGLPAADGGSLFLRPGMNLNGIELAQALTSGGIKLAVFNACWGAQPAVVNHQVIPYSSLAEVLIRHGVPAVLGMRDEIADHESHSFIQAFTHALRSRKPIDEAVAIARQQLLTLYRFNQPAWTLPILYLHPNFDGELIKTVDEGITELPETSIPGIASAFPHACLRSETDTCHLRPGINRIGRTADNDIVIAEPSVSRLHAEILCRNTLIGNNKVQVYYLQEKSTYGTTWILEPKGWRQIHQEEVPLKSGMQLKFGSTRSQTWEFIIEDS
ncbi:MAG: CHAT domain-containing protein [Nostocaceae cyanobacterium]|nr:CHAT domain-containing protein [Nostocaceae cyanobacterium]